LLRYKLVDSNVYCSLAGSWAIRQAASACTMYLASERSDTNCFLHACLLRKSPSNPFGSVTNPHSGIGRASEGRTRSLKGLELADQHNWGLAVLLRRGRDSATSRTGRSTCKMVSSCYALSENISCGISEGNLQNDSDWVQTRRKDPLDLGRHVVLYTIALVLEYNLPLRSYAVLDVTGYGDVRNVSNVCECKSQKIINSCLLTPNSSPEGSLSSVVYLEMEVEIA
jgi:hypothetical protein